MLVPADQGAGMDQGSRAKCRGFEQQKDSNLRAHVRTTIRLMALIVTDTGDDGFLIISTAISVSFTTAIGNMVALACAVAVAA